MFTEITLELSYLEQAIPAVQQEAGPGELLNSDLPVLVAAPVAAADLKFAEMTERQPEEFASVVTAFEPNPMVADYKVDVAEDVVSESQSPELVFEQMMHYSALATEELSVDHFVRPKVAMADPDYTELGH